jgi:uncharacterized protein YbjT (DUF2867 family)
MKILVIGGTGHVGSEVVKELKKRDADVRVLVRKPDVKSLPGVETVVGDLLNPVSIEKALEGVDKLYLLNAVTPDELTQGLIAYNLARKRKLSHAATLTKLLGHEPRAYEDFAHETIGEWQKLADSRAAA